MERGLSEQEAQTQQDDFVEHLEDEEPFAYREYLGKQLKSRLVRDRLHKFKVQRLLFENERQATERAST